MDKQQLCQVSKLADSHIGRSRRLQAFDTGYTDTDMGSLDHGDVVRSITYS